MDARTNSRTEAATGSGSPDAAAPPPARPRSGPKPTAYVLAVIIAAIVAATAWFLALPPPLLIQGVADSTRIDLAARVDGRVKKILVQRGQDLAADAVLVEIDNPELVARLAEAQAAKRVADAQLARFYAGTRSEQIAARKAEMERAAASVALAQATHDRIQPLAASQFASQQRLDEATANLSVAQRTYDQAKLAYQEAVAGFMREEVVVAEAKVAQADAAVQSLKALVDQLVVTAPAPTQVYEFHIEQGEVVSPGVPLFALVDMADIWIRFDLREDLARGLKVGDRLEVQIPALGDRKVVTEVRLIASKGEYADWRATRATGDFDLRTFAIRAYPVEKLAGLRPGMSAYADWPGAKK
jgi:HlyD family secretion protein